MKRVILLLLAFAFSYSSYAVDVGLGASVSATDSNYIYVPINLNADYRIEPYFSRYRYNTDYQTSTNESYKNDQLGIGFFKVNKSSENINVLIGGRAAYIEYSNSLGYNEYGYQLSPVLGFEYYVVKNLSIGAAASWVYTKINGRVPSDSYKQTGDYTSTEVTIKYYFQ